MISRINVAIEVVMTQFYSLYFFATMRPIQNINLEKE
jgi:hypothetical protein